MFSVSSSVFIGGGGGCKLHHMTRAYYDHAYNMYYWGMGLVIGPDLLMIETVAMVLASSSMHVT